MTNCYYCGCAAPKGAGTAFGRQGIFKSVEVRDRTGKVIRQIPGQYVCQTCYDKGLDAPSCLPPSKEAKGVVADTGGQL